MVLRMTSLGIALVSWRGGAWALEGTLTVGTLAAFLSYVQRFFQPIENFSEQYTLMQSAMAGRHTRATPRRRWSVCEVVRPTVCLR
jgi:ABC-type multidrug transport system fused ATPase/permease subunit